MATIAKVPKTAINGAAAVATAPIVAKPLAPAPKPPATPATPATLPAIDSAILVFASIGPKTTSDSRAIEAIIILFANSPIGPGRNDIDIDKAPTAPPSARSFPPRTFDPAETSLLLSSASIITLVA